VGQVNHPQKALLFTAVLYSDQIDSSAVLNRLENDFGSIALRSKSFSFTETNYYEEEMGKDLTREWVAFHRCVEQDEIASIKLHCNQIERQYFSIKSRRLANIDPGYLTLGKVVLATTKDNQHRLYLGDGIFGEVTLRYRHGSYVPWEWTYRDYRREESLRFFNQVRSLYLSTINGDGHLD
jgi:hypothetical protein